MAKRSLEQTISEMKVTATPGNVSVLHDPNDIDKGRDPGKHGNDPKSRATPDAPDKLLTDPEQKNREVAATTKQTKTKGRKADKAGGETGIVKQGSSGKNVTTGKTVAASEDGGTNTSRASSTDGETALVKQGSSGIKIVKQKESIDYTDEELELLTAEELELLGELLDEEDDEDEIFISDEIIDHIEDLDSDELKERYAELLAILDEEGFDDEDLEEEYDKNGELITAESEEVVSEIRRRITAEDIDVAEDINALLFDEGDLSEEFQVKAKTIFEAAVVAKVNSEIDVLEESFKVEFAEALESAESALAEKVDDYLGYVIEEWMTKNDLAVERGLQAEITEGFISGMKALFSEHYIDVPEEKMDVLNALAEENDELKAALNDAIEKNIDAKNENDETEVEGIMQNACEGLTDTQADKLLNLAEGVSYEDPEQFEEALTIIKESYFTDEWVPAEEEGPDEELAELIAEETGQTSSSQMNSYVNTLGRQVKKQ